MGLSIAPIEVTTFPLVVLVLACFPAVPEVRGFNEGTRLGYTKKKCQNKYNELKRLYFNWRDGQTHTGLGRDPLTGEVTTDPEWYGANPGVLTTHIS